MNIEEQIRFARENGYVCLTAEVQSWPVSDDGYRISPGVYWCKEGSRIKVGDQVFVGMLHKIEDRCEIWSDTSLRSDVSLGAGAAIRGSVHCLGDLCLREGASISSGNKFMGYVYMAKYSAIYSDCMFYGDTHIGEDSIVLFGANIAGGLKVGASAVIYENLTSTLPKLTLGENSIVGPNAMDPIDLGVGEEYRITMYGQAGIAMISAGCRTLSLRAAIQYCKDRADRAISKLILEGAINIAKLRGWEV